MSRKDIPTRLEALEPLPPKVYPTQKESDGLELGGIVTLKAITLKTGSIIVLSLVSVGLILS